MKKKYLLLILFSIALAQHGYGWGSGPPKIGVIEGNILDASTENPIEYASVSIYQSESEKLVQGGISDSDGYFNINEIPPGRFFVVIEFIGYEMLTIENVNLNRDDGIKKDLGTLSLIPRAIEADEISVIDDMPTIEFETDKMVYTPSKDILADSGTAEDVLNNVPMVLVDQDGSVTLRGNSNVKILVNGRQNRTGEGEKNVDNIPAVLIERIEVITSPSVKYDPEGMAGIINIILKKGDVDGFNGSIKIYGKHNNHHSLDEMNGFSISGNYKKDKLNFYSSYSLTNRYRNSIGYRRVDTTYPESEDYNDNDTPNDFDDDTGYPSITNSIDYDEDNENKKNNHKLRLGADYYLTDHLLLNGEVNYSIHQSYGDNKRTINAPAEDVGIISTIDMDDDDNYDIEGVIGLIKSYDNPDQEFSIFLSKDYEVDNENEILKELEWDDTTKYYEKINMTEIDISYRHPINKEAMIEFGYDGLFNDNTETSDYMLTYINEEQIDIDKEHIDHFSGSNDFGYKRSIHGFFFEYSSKISDRWSIKQGLRYEQVNKDISFNKNPDIWYECKDLSDDMYGNDYTSLIECENECEGEGTCSEVLPMGNIYSMLLSDTPDSTYDANYFSIYPSLHFTYNITDEKSIQFSISQRVERPGSGGHGGGSRQIRPFPRNIYNEQFIFIGNPFLEPEYSTQFEIGYKSPIPMGFFYSNIYYHSVQNVIEWYYYDNPYNDDANILTFRNADEGKTYGLELFTMLMGQTLGGGYWYNTISDGSDDVELNGYDEGFNAYMKINLPEKYMPRKIFGFEFGFYYMKMKNKYGSLFGDKGTLWANMGFSKSLFKERGRLSFNINNLFNSGGFQMQITKPVEGSFYDEDWGVTRTDGSEYSDVNYSRNGRTYSLTFKFNFGKMQKNKRKFQKDRGHGDSDDMDMGY